MALELDAEIEKDTALRLFVTSRVKARALEVDYKLTDTDRADLVDQIKSFWGEALCEIIDAAFDRETADDDDDGDD